MCTSPLRAYATSIRTSLSPQAAPSADDKRVYRIGIAASFLSLRIDSVRRHSGTLAQASVLSLRGGGLRPPEPQVRGTRVNSARGSWGKPGFPHVQQLVEPPGQADALRHGANGEQRPGDVRRGRRAGVMPDRQALVLAAEDDLR